MTKIPASSDMWTFSCSIWLTFLLLDLGPQVPPSMEVMKVAYPNVRENAFSVSPSNIMLTVCFINLNYFPSIHNFVTIFP